MKYLLGILSLVVVGLFGFLFYLNSKINNIVVIDIIKVVNEFELKKELEEGVSQKLGYYTGKLDSLKVVFDKTKSSTVKKNSQKLYQQIEGDYQYALELSNKNINEQVWKRLNPLIDEFGKEEGYRVIIGANGMGSVLYKEDAIDKTKELIGFINKKFQTGG